MAIYAFDIDGTIADNRHRHEMLPSNSGGTWDEYWELCDLDPPIPGMAKFVSELATKGKILMITGRSRSVTRKTSVWLFNNGFVFDDLIMRGDKDYRPNHVYKYETLHPTGDNPVTVLFDDNPKVRKHFLEQGSPIPVVTVNFEDDKES